LGVSETTKFRSEDGTGELAVAGKTMAGKTMAGKILTQAGRGTHEA